MYGIIRRSSSFNTGRIEHLYADRHRDDVRLKLVYGDLADSSALCEIVSRVRPDEVYNLGAQSFVSCSFELSEYTADVDGLGALRLLNACRTAGLEKSVRFYQASTSEMYGLVQEIPQTERTPFHPRSPYACAKLYAFWQCVNYREAYGMFVSNGILFNHESPRRGPTFLTRKVTRAVARIARGLQKCVYLGNIEATRDWGHAKDYVEGMWRMLQADKADDFVLATNETHSVRSFVEKAFAAAGLPIRWEGERGSQEETGVLQQDSGRVVVRIDAQYFRPSEVERLLGCADKAKAILGWTPTTSYDDLVAGMVEADMALVEAGDLMT